MVVLIMGVSGAGKTAVGAELARVIGAPWQFLDADDFHPSANVEKMRSGTPLSDADRWPWLDLINLRLRELQAQGMHAVLACSALKEIYRERLRAGLADFRVVFLHGNAELVGARLQQRQHRYMPASLLASQFATLEAPGGALAIDIGASVEAIVARIRTALLSNTKENMQTATIKIEGMTCQGCVRSVSNVLTRLPGVHNARVSLERSEAEVQFDPAQVSPQQMRAAIDAAGYTSVV